MAEPVFAAYRPQYSYDPLPLDARTEARAEGAQWIRERVSFTAAIVVAGGLMSYCRSLPGADGLNFAPHVRIPVLMLHGRYDILLPWESEEKPLYDLLGTPAPDKVRKLYDTDHFIPRTDLMRESLAWLDKYLGPVKR